MTGMDLVDGIVVWSAIQRGDDASAYRIHFPIVSIVALQMQVASTDFLPSKNYLLTKRGLFKNEKRRNPIRWRLDSETAKEYRLLVQTTHWPIVSLEGR